MNNQSSTTKENNFWAKNQKWLIFSLTIIFSLSTFVFVVQADNRWLDGCVTDEHFNDSFNHFFRLAGAFGAGQNVMTSLTVREYYQDRLNCIDSYTWASKSKKQAKLLELEQLQMVGRLELKDGAWCVRLINDVLICG